MKIIEGDNYDVYIYFNDHFPAHCHVRYSDHSESVVGLPMLQHLHGKRLNKRVQKELLENIEMLTDKWVELNE